MKLLYSVLLSMISLLTVAQKPQSRDLVPLYDSTNYYIKASVPGGWRHFSKTKNYQYDNRGNLLTFTQYGFWNGGFNNDHRYTYTYDTNNNKLTMLTETYGSENWENDKFEINTYNTLGYHTNQLFKEWDNLWIDRNEIVKTYDMAWNLIEYMKIYHGDWFSEITYREIREYNTSNLVTLLVTFKSPDPYWPQDSTIYIYDDQNRLITRIYKFPSEEFPGNDANKYIYSYNELNQVDSILFQSLGFSGTYETLLLDTYIYDEQGNVITFLSQQKQSGAWVNDKIVTSTYNQDGFLIHRLGLKRFWPSNILDKNEEYRYSFDANNILMGQSKRLYTDNIVTSADSTAYYFGVLATPEQAIKELATAYPNPTTGIFSFKSTEPVIDIHVIDINGKEVFYLPYGQFIDITQLPAGFYLIKATSGNKPLTIKVMKM